jgi:hypothetical protein
MKTETLKAMIGVLLAGVDTRGCNFDTFDTDEPSPVDSEQDDDSLTKEIIDVVK